MSKICKNRTDCPYSEISKDMFPCNKCEEPNKQYPVTCKDCRYYPCIKSENSLEPCTEFSWD